LFSVIKNALLRIVVDKISEEERMYDRAQIVLTPAEIFGCLLDKEYPLLVRFTSLLKDIDFTHHPPFDLIYEVFVHCVDVHRSWTMELLVYHLGEDAKKLQSYLALVDASRDVDVSYVIEHLVHYKTKILLDDFIQSMHRANGDVNDVLRKYTTRLGELVINSTQRMELVPATELLVKASQPDTSTSSSKKRLPLDLGFDDCLDGGIVGGEILIIVGPTGAGKSTMMLHCCLNAIQNNLRTLYVSLELSTSLIAQKLRCYTLVKPRAREYLDLLHVVKFPTKSVTLEEVFVIADQLNVDVVALDYLDILNYGGSRDRIWATLEDLTAKFRGYCEERDIIGLTVSQAVREVVGSQTNKIVDLDDVSLSIGKVFTADFVITLTPPNVLHNQNTGLLYLAKNRRGPKHLQPVRIDYENVIIQPIVKVDYADFKLNSKFLKEDGDAQKV